MFVQYILKWRGKNSFMNVCNILMIVKNMETNPMSINRHKKINKTFGGPVAKIPCVQCRGMSLFSGWEQDPYAMQYGQKSIFFKETSTKYVDCGQFIHHWKIIQPWRNETETDYDNTGGFRTIMLMEEVRPQGHTAYGPNTEVSRRGKLQR